MKKKLWFVRVFFLTQSHMAWLKVSACLIKVRCFGGGDVCNDAEPITRQAQDDPGASTGKQGCSRAESFGENIRENIGENHVVQHRTPLLVCVKPLFT